MKINSTMSFRFRLTLFADKFSGKTANIFRFGKTNVKSDLKLVIAPKSFKLLVVEGTKFDARLAIRP